jgi:hypothetical protein
MGLLKLSREETPHLGRAPDGFLPICPPARARSSPRLIERSASLWLVYFRSLFIFLARTRNPWIARDFSPLAYGPWVSILSRMSIYRPFRKTRSRPHLGACTHEWRFKTLGMTAR